MRFDYFCRGPGVIPGRGVFGLLAGIFRLRLSEPLEFANLERAGLRLLMSQSRPEFAGSRLRSPSERIRIDAHFGLVAPLIFSHAAGSHLHAGFLVRRAGRLIFLVLLGLFALQAAPVYLVYVFSQAHHRRRILESIEAVGGRITARLAADPRQILELDLSGTDVAELPWESFHALDEVESLNFAGTGVTDEKLDHLGRLRSLRRLCLDETPVTDAAIPELRSFPHLKILSLNETALTERDSGSCIKLFPESKSSPGIWRLRTTSILSRISPMTPSFDRPTILMCPPDYYGIEYEINPWMSRSRQSDAETSRKQWQSLHDLLLSLGAEIRLLTPVKGLPDFVFTANAGLVWREKVFLSRFRHAARQGETVLDDQWFQSQGFQTIPIPERGVSRGPAMRCFAETRCSRGISSAAMPWRCSGWQEKWAAG